jgi:hypothetical protein
MNREKISIYRFTSFESLINIVQSQKLTFVNHELWADPYEGFVFKALKSVDGRSQIESIAKKIIGEDYVNIMSLDFFSNCIHGQSWSKCEESDALWRIYSNNNKAIRLEINKDSINNLKSVTCNEVVYKNFSSLEEEISSLVDESGKKIFAGKILLRKRTAFEHEKEVRLLTNINLDFISDNKTDQQREFMNQGLEALRKNGQINDQEFQNGRKNNNKKNIPKVVFIDFSHIQNFITSILVHPLSPNWYVDTVKEYCRKNELKFIGKSKLYTLNF